MPYISLIELEKKSGVSSNGCLRLEADVACDPHFDKAQCLVSIWRDLRSGGYVSRKAVDPVVLGAALLPYMVIIDVLPDKSDFRWRLFGSRHEQEYGMNLTGVSVNDLIKKNPSIADLHVILTQCVVERAPTFFEFQYISEGKLDRKATGAFVPLQNQNGHVFSLLGCSDWVYD